MRIKITFEETRERSFIVDWDKFRHENISAWRNWKETMLDEEEEVGSADIIEFIGDLMSENGESIIDDQYGINDDGRVALDILDVREY